MGKILHILNLLANVSDLVPVQLRDGHDTSVGNTHCKADLGHHHDSSVVCRTDESECSSVGGTIFEVLDECVFCWLEVTSPPSKHRICFWSIES